MPSSLCADKVGGKPDIRVYDEPPIGWRQTHSLILSAGKADILIVIDDLHFLFELFQNGGRFVS
jgi:hypothetical protein